LRPADPQEFACKAIVPDMTTSFDLHCIDAVARSNHRNIVQVQDRWFEQFPTQKVFVQTELCDGNLNQYIEYHRTAGIQIGYQDVWKITLDIVDALTYAHELGWSHRNLKPTNGTLSI
jgi:serine/threonine protein kinase